MGNLDKRIEAISKQLVKPLERLHIHWSKVDGPGDRGPYQWTLPDGSIELITLEEFKKRGGITWDDGDTGNRD